MAESVDFSNLIRSVWKRLPQLLMVSLIMALLAGTYMMRTYRPHYQSQATIVVYEKSVYRWRGVQNATETAAAFREILSSSLAQKRMAQAAGLDHLPGSISCKNVPNTNMMQLTATAQSPRDTVTTLRAVLNNYNAVAEELLGEQVMEVIRQPSVPMEPTDAYNEWKLLAKAFIATAGAAAVLVAGLSYLRDDIKNSEQAVRKLDARLLASVQYERPKRKKTNKQRGSELLVSHPAVSFGYIETFRKLCTRFDYAMQAGSHKAGERGQSKAGEQRQMNAGEQKQSNIDGQGRPALQTVLVTSVLEGEGKSTISANLAISLARQGKHVVLIDCDLRKPSQNRLFRLSYGGASVQLGEYLRGNAKSNDLLRMTGTQGLLVVAGKDYFDDAPQLLASEAMTGLLETLKKHVDYIILDTPPLARTIDAEELMRVSDAGLLVVRQSKALTRDINDAIDLFRENECKLLGCILNYVEGGLPGRLFEHHDSYYGRYGRGSYGAYRSYKQANYHKQEPRK